MSEEEARSAILLMDEARSRCASAGRSRRRSTSASPSASRWCRRSSINTRARSGADRRSMRWTRSRCAFPSMSSRASWAWTRAGSRNSRAWSEGRDLGLNPFRSEEGDKPLRHLPERAVLLYGRVDAPAPRAAEGRSCQRHDDVCRGKARRSATARSPTISRAFSSAATSPTTDLIGNAIWLFLTHPDELAKLKADPSLINNAGRGSAALRIPCRHHRPHRAARDGGRRLSGQAAPVAVRLAARRQPRSGSVPRSAPLRHRAQGRAPLSRSVAGCICASARRLRAWRRRCAIASFFDAFANARLAEPHPKPRCARRRSSAA